MCQVAERHTVPEVIVRWMVRGDCQRVAEISKSAMQHRKPLSQREAVIALKQKTVVGAVAEMHYDKHHSQIAGFVFVSTQSEQTCEIVIACVDPRWQRAGIGDLLLEHVERISRHIGYYDFSAVVHERELDAQLWLQANDYQCSHIHKHFDGNDSGYIFTKRVS